MFVTRPYHPAARVVTAKPKPARKAGCRFHLRGTFCVSGCDACEARLTARQLDVLTQQAATAVRTFGRSGQKGSAR